MALYTLADPHLSFGTDKPMDIFGGAWHGYVSALRENLSVLREGDTLVIPGDLSWGINLEQAEPDFRFLASFPGRKILVKGNHDLWSRASPCAAHAAGSLRKKKAKRMTQKF